MSALEQDRQSRQLSLEEFEAPVWIEAGAGTGKTALLVARLCVWCLGRGWDASESNAPTGSRAGAVLAGLCALTFTEKAAAEMQERFRAALERLAEGALPVGLSPEQLDCEPALVRMRAQLLLEALQEPIAQTLHAFAQRVVRLDPPSAGFPLSYAVDAESLGLRECIRAVVDGALRAALGDTVDARMLDYLRADGTPQRLVESLEALVGEGVQPEDLAEPRYTLGGLRQRFGALVRGLHELEPLLAPYQRAPGNSKVTQRVPAVLAERLALAETLLAGPWEDLESFSRALCAWIEGFDAKVFEKLAQAELGTVERRLLADPEAVQARLAALAPDLRLLAEIDAQHYERARELLHELLCAVRARMRAEGLVSFQELLEGALAVLRDPELCRVQASGLRQLLVDEFQDTDPIQCEIVARLALHPGASGRPGLFIVGDPKQSIYAWRSADLQAYEDFKQQVRAAGGHFGVLTCNYRSTARILTAVESVFAEAMRAQAGIQPQFQPLFAHAQRSGPALRVVCTWQSQERTPADAARVLEASWIARRILEAQADGARWQDHAILVRRGSQYEALISALRAAEIPYEVRGDRSFYRRREILDAAAWLRASIDPSDTLALIAALRSSACGVPDAAWHPLQQAGFFALVLPLGMQDSAEDALSLARLQQAIGRAAELCADHLGERAGAIDWPRLLGEALALLARLRRHAREASVEEFFRELRAGTRLEWIEARRYLGEYRLANLQAFFEAQERRAEALDGDLQALLRELHRDLESEREQREAKPLREARDAVQLMTIHQSKGLDFERVYLVGLDTDRTRQRSKPLVRVTRLAERRCSIRLEGLPDPYELEAEVRREAIEQAEHVRIFYVAMTRPKQELILLGNFSKKDFRQLAWEAHTHGGMLPCFADEGVLASLAQRQSIQHGEFELEVLDVADGAPAEGLRARGPSHAFPPARARDRAAALRRQQLAFSRSFSAVFPSTLPSSLAADLPAALATGLPAVLSVPAAAGGEGQSFGTAVHAALEQWFRDETLSLEAALAAHLERPVDLLRRLAREPFASLLELARRTRIGVELELFARADPEDELALHLSGRMDLVYADPRDGAWVVVDFKTDPAAAIPQRLSHYSEQVEAYCRGLRRALPGQPVRGELWFLLAGEIRKLPC